MHQAILTPDTHACVKKEIRTLRDEIILADAQMQRRGICRCFSLIYDLEPLTHGFSRALVARTARYWFPPPSLQCYLYTFCGFAIFVFLQFIL